MVWWRSRGTGRCGERKQGKRQEHMRVGKHMTKCESNLMLGPKSLYDVYTVFFSILHFFFQNLILVSKLNQSLSSIHLFSHTCHHTSVHDWNLKIKILSLIMFLLRSWICNTWHQFGYGNNLTRIMLCSLLNKVLPPPPQLVASLGCFLNYIWTFCLLHFFLFKYPSLD